jgi:ABC-type sugar transport system permease subunit
LAVASPPVSDPPTPKPPVPTRRSIKFRGVDIREQLTGYLFVLPAFFLVFFFGLFPIGYAFYMSLRRWRVIDRGFIGLANYEKALGDWWGALMFAGGFLILLLAYWVWDRAVKSESDRGFAIKTLGALILLAAGFLIATGWGRMIATGDDDFLNSLPITLYYAIGAVPIQLGIALVLAYILFQKIRGQQAFRMIFFLPYITPVIATALVFRVIFSPRPTSIANRFLEVFNLPAQKWLFEPKPMLEILVGSDMIFGMPIEGFWAGPSMALLVNYDVRHLDLHRLQHGDLPGWTGQYSGRAL